MLKALRSWDPLYGLIKMSEFEFSLLNLPEVQRLRYVRMCNINSLLVTGASEISRFEHTIGVMFLARKWCEAHLIPNSQAEEVIAAAVLHDMQTGPFGHSMQYVLEDNAPAGTFIHEDLSHGWKSTYHQEVLAGASFAGRPFSAQSFLGTRWDNVARIIRGEGRFGPLIAGTMDLDNIDNVIRLAYHVGVATREDCQLPIQLSIDLDVVDRNISLPSSAIERVARWQEVRRRLYELLLLDWAEFSAKAMLTRAIERASAYQLIGSDSWVRTDSEFLELLERSAIGEAQEVRNMVRRLRHGDLYEPISILSTSSIELYAELTSIKVKSEVESELLTDTSFKAIKLLVHFILDKGKTERQITFIDPYTGDRRSVGASSSQLLCGIFVSRTTTENERTTLAKKFQELLEKRGAKHIQLVGDPMEEEAPPPTQQRLL